MVSGHFAASWQGAANIDISATQCGRFQRAVQLPERSTGHRDQAHRTADIGYQWFPSAQRYTSTGIVMKRPERPGADAPYQEAKEGVPIQCTHDKLEQSAAAETSPA